MQLTLIILGTLCIYLLINLARVIKGRVQPDYLKRSSSRTALWLVSAQALLVAVSLLDLRYSFSATALVYCAAGLQLVVALTLLMAYRNNVKAARPPELSATFAQHELPTLSVCIPARNETEDLEECLKSLLASTYPKLEILVLDDCSQNKRTPEIIRGFAHEGIRFVAGQLPPQSWLAKNYAYQQLAEQANGDLLLFCGIDSRFEPDSLLNLVKTLLQEQKSMISVLPRNVRHNRLGIQPLLTQPLRYAWELMLPRKIIGQPPVLSTTWLIKRQSLEKSGGFKAVSRKIVPESYFARLAAKTDEYRFLIANSRVGLTSIKSLSEQKATAIRTRYPQLHRRIELVALMSLAELSLLVWPLIIAVAALLRGQLLLGAISLATYLLFSVIYGLVVSLTYRKFTPVGYLILPLAVMYDLVLLNYSMWQYEFGEVIWKGRNVCIPVMRVYESLPKPD